MNLNEFLKARKRYLLWSMVILILSFLFFEAFSTYLTFAFTIKGQECFPYRFWFIRKGVIPPKGEYVYFRNPRIGARWVKIVYGAEGNRIEVVKIPEKERSKIFIDEIGKSLTVQGYIFIYREDIVPFRVFEAFERDTKGRPLPLIEEGVIPKGKYFVMSDALRSFDSRYWGLVDEKDILGKAYPIF